MSVAARDAGDTATGGAQGRPGDAPPPLRPTWRRDRLGRRQVRLTLVATLTVGTLLGGLQVLQDVRGERDRIAAIAEGVVELVEPAAARAAYTYDDTLAQTVRASLLKLGSVARVELTDHLGVVLAAGSTPRPVLPLRGVTDALFGERLVYRRLLTAPPGPQGGGLEEAPVGALTVELDTRVLADDLLARSAWLLGLGLVKTAILAIVLTALYYLLITGPLVRLTTDVEAQGARGGRIRVARTHAHDELGRLATTISAAFERMRAAEAERAEVDRQFAAAAETMPDGLAILDQAGRLGFFNPQFALNLPDHARPRLARGQALGDALASAAAEAPLWHAARAHEIPDIATAQDAMLTLRDGRSIELRGRAMPGGGRVLVTADVTARRALEEELRRAERLSAIGTLAGGIAHDFSNVLAIISAATEVGLAHQPQDGPARPAMERVLGACRRGRHLVEQIMAFSRAQGEPTSVIDLADSVGGAIELCRPLVDAAVALSFEPRAQSLPVAATDTQIHQIVANLMMNAAQAMPEGGRIRIRTRRDRGEARLTVSDTGTGMDRATMARAYEPFFTTKPVGQGTGLGLSVVYGVVQGLGGRIEIGSTPGRGTTVTIRLPLARVPELVGK